MKAKDETRRGDWEPQYKAAGTCRWFVLNIRWPSGTCGAVRRGEDRKWRVEQDPAAQPYPSRDAAARAEQRLALDAGGTILPDRADQAPAPSPAPPAGKGPGPGSRPDCRARTVSTRGKR